MLRDPVFAIDVTIQGPYAVVRAEGELDVAAVPELDVQIRNAARRTPRVVVDLRSIDFIDTFALQALLALQEEADASPSWALHAVPGPGIQRLLDIAGARGCARAEPASVVTDHDRDLVRRGGHGQLDHARRIVLIRVCDGVGHRFRDSEHHPVDVDFQVGCEPPHRAPGRGHAVHGGRKLLAQRHRGLGRMRTHFGSMLPAPGSG